MSPQPTSRDLIPVFRRAAEVITTRGLNQRSYYANEHAGAAPTPSCPVDAAGALSVAVTGHPVPPEDLGPVLLAAVETFAGRVYATTTDPDPIERIASWSDGIGRTAAEVAAAFLTAADELARVHYALVPVHPSALVPVRVRTSDGYVWWRASISRGVPRYVLAGMPTDVPIGVQVDLGELAARFGVPSAWGGAA